MSIIAVLIGAAILSILVAATMGVIENMNQGVRLQRFRSGVNDYQEELRTVLKDPNGCKFSFVGTPPIVVDTSTNQTFNNVKDQANNTFANVNATVADGAARIISFRLTGYQDVQPTVGRINLEVEYASVGNVIGGSQLKRTILMQVQRDGTTHVITGCVALAGASGAGGGTISSTPLDTKVFDSSGTWTKPSEGTVAVVECWGGGASGSELEGGGGGGYSKNLVLTATMGATEPVTVGAGGAGPIPNYGTGFADGAPGGRSSVGLHVSASGGGAYVSSPGDVVGGPGGYGSAEQGGSGAGYATYAAGSSTMCAGAGGGAIGPGGRSGCGGNGGASGGVKMSSANGGISTPGSRPGGGGGAGQPGGPGRCKITVY